MTHGIAGSAWFWVLVAVLACAVYALPTIIAVIRGAEGLALVLVVNLIGGAVVVGWPAALILAAGLPRRAPPPWVPPARQPDPRPWLPEGDVPRDAIRLLPDRTDPDLFQRRA